MIRREASINDVRIEEQDRRIFGSRSPDEAATELPVR
jgi:nuclear transport factor 2 (NTF2) superfamily protein